MIFEIFKDGSFHVIGEKIRLMDAYPAIDGKPIKPVNVAVNEAADRSVIVYTLSEGHVSMTLWHGEEFGVEAELNGIGQAEWFHPLFGAKVEGMAGLYRQGFGMMGPSGFLDLQQLKEQKGKTESHGLMALTASQAHLLLSVDHHNQYMNLYALSHETGVGYTLSSGFRLEKVGGERKSLPLQRFSESDSLEGGLRQTARRIADAMGARVAEEPAFHWCSWYYMYQNFDRHSLHEYLEGFKQSGVPFKYVQIDAGYFASAGDWLEPNHRWPHGLEAAFQDIEKAGYLPGIWIGPFMVGNRSRLYREHPDWILRDLDGAPVTPWQFYREEKVWGYLDEEYYVLDTSHPEAMNYMRAVFRTLRGWGARLFKTDFMFWGIRDSAAVQRHTPGKTSFEYFREFLQAVREEIGDESFWLGCIAPYLPFIGYADGMRIAGDVGAQWGGQGFGPENLLREAVGSNYMNWIYWQNDPDALLLRDFHTFLTNAEVEALTMLQAFTGGMIYTSDPVHKLTPDRMDLLRSVIPAKKQMATLPYLDRRRKDIVMVHRLNDDKAMVLILNPTKEELVDCYSIEELTSIRAAYVRDWNGKAIATEAVKELVLRIPAHHCKVLFMSTKELPKENYGNIWNWPAGGQHEAH